jgi:hypothetical protein
MVAPITELTTTSPQQQWFAQISVHLHDQLRQIFGRCEQELLADREQVALCCELRRLRRIFTDNFLDHLWRRCESPTEEWIIGSSSNVARARTLIYLADANNVVRALYQEQADSVGRIVSVWQQQTSQSCGVFDCPFSPHVLVRLYFLSLPELPLPTRVRYRLATLFIQDLSRFYVTLLENIFSVLRRKGIRFDSVTPLPMPEWWEPLEKQHQPSVAALALVVPPRSSDAMLLLAQEVAAAALSQNEAEVLALLGSQHSTALLPWLLECMNDTSAVPLAGKKILCLLAGPLLYAACDEAFADHAHPARQALDEWRHWALGWQECLGIDGVVPEYCCELATDLSQRLLQEPSTMMAGWQLWLDYLRQLRKRLQQDLSAVVASTRLSLEVMEVRAEVDALLASRADREHWPLVAVEILRDYWTALLMDIHWREGTTSNQWLPALTVADELLMSVQLINDMQERQRLMKRAPMLLQNLRKGFDAIGCDRRTYSLLLDRLQNVHLALLKGESQSQMCEPSVLWPDAAPMPVQGEPFDVGVWLRLQDGRVLSVEFSDGWCTVLCDAHSAALECCATAMLQSDFYEGNLEIVMPLASLLPSSVA